MPMGLHDPRAEHHGMDIVLAVAAVWIALDVAIVAFVSTLSARGAVSGRSAARRRDAASRRPATVLQLPRIGETSVPVTDR